MVIEVLVDLVGETISFEERAVASESNPTCTAVERNPLAISFPLNSVLIVYEGRISVRIDRQKVQI